MTSKPPKSFAEGTKITAAHTRDEIERMLKRWGATDFAYKSGREAAVGFRCRDRNILFRLRLPDPQAEEFTTSVRVEFGKRQSRQKVSEATAEDRWEKASRRLWRSLALAIKAKLVAVDDGIEEFEEAFLGHIVVPGTDGATVYEQMRDPLALRYQGRNDVPLLPSPGRN